MGADLHLYVEYKSKDNSTWSPFGGRINPGRNYTLFALMAGVRNCGEYAYPEPKGFPEDAAYEAASDNYLYIDDSDIEGCVKRERAEQWIKDGYSKYKKGSDKFVTNPDWHSHSYFSYGEFKSVFSTYLLLEEENVKIRDAERLKTISNMPELATDHWFNEPYKMYIEPKYQAILAAMDKLEELEFETRVVFWFDN